MYKILSCEAVCMYLLVPASCLLSPGSIPVCRCSAKRTQCPWPLTNDLPTGDLRITTQAQNCTCIDPTHHTHYLQHRSHDMTVYFTSPSLLTCHVLVYLNHRFLHTTNPRSQFSSSEHVATITSQKRKIQTQIYQCIQL